MKIEFELDEEQTKLFEDMVAGIPSGDIYSGDIFSTDCIGSWAYGLAHRKESFRANLEWLIFDKSKIKAKNEEELVEQFRDFSLTKDDLPEGYYILDLRKCREIVKAGVIQHGISFIDGGCDAIAVNFIIQEVLLGEDRYL